MIEEEEKLKIALETNQNIEQIIDLISKILLCEDKNNLLFILKKYIYDERIRIFIKQNVKELFQKANYDQLAIMLLLDSELNLSPNEKRLTDYIRKNRVIPYNGQYLNLEKIVIYDYLNQFFELFDKYLEKSKTDSIKHLGTGRSSSSIRIGDYVLKIGELRDTPDFEDRFYRFNKRLERIVLEKPKFYFEIQPFIDYNPDDINVDIIDRLKKDCLNHGYKLLDCHKYDCAILKNYRLADIQGQIIPQHFIDEPVVLVDIDAIKKI